jgi:hypothetical protein
MAMPSPILLQRQRQRQRRRQQQRRRPQQPPLTWTTTVILLFGWTICHSWQGALGQSFDCYQNLNTITLREGLQTASNLLELRTYTLCPGTTYSIGTLDNDNELVAMSGQDMLPLRSNLHIKCGDTGSRGNDCIINGGDVQVDGTDFYTIPGGTVENVTLEGLTFTGSMKHMVWINKRGNVLFKDCVFRVRSAR